MVHLNGRVLPEDSFNQTEFNGAQTQISLNEKLSPQRRARSAHATRGPKPLLPRSLKEALQLAELLSKSKLIPKGFDTPETCLVGILYGMEVGLSPIAALQRMAVIDGRPTIWGDAALALVQASGLLQSIKEEVIEETKADADAVTACVGGSTGSSPSTSRRSTASLTAICKVRREGRLEPTIGTFSVDDAKRAGLWQKPGPWTDYPTRMLTMRARAFALRDAFPDVLAGLYIREEFVGKERDNAMLERDQSIDDAEWNAAATNGTNGATLNKADPQADVQYHTASKSSETEQAITSGYDFTPETHRRPSYPAHDQGDRITSGYDFTPNTHGPSDPHDMRDSSSSRLSSQGQRRAPPPPPAADEDIEKASGIEARGLVISNGLTYHKVLAHDPQISAVVTEDDGEIVSASDAALDPETLLDLLDSALCCALDLPTFHEVEDDFEERLRPLSKDHRKRAQKIIDRHHKRVADLDRLSKVPENNQSANDMITPKLPRRLEAALSQLGIGHSRNRDRRSHRTERPSQSLPSWNARHRVAAFEINRAAPHAVDDSNDIRGSDDPAEAGE